MIVLSSEIQEFQFDKGKIVTVRHPSQSISKTVPSLQWSVESGSRKEQVMQNGAAY